MEGERGVSSRKRADRLGWSENILNDWSENIDIFSLYFGLE
jgi:hypothetical protein